MLWQENGRRAEVRSLVLETLDTFSKLGVGREAIAAVFLLSRAAAQDRLDITILRTAAAELQKADR